MKPSDWFDRAPEDEQKRRDYFVRLITLLTGYVNESTMEDCIEKAGGTKLNRCACANRSSKRQ
jgi:hypothetical protein